MVLGITTQIKRGWNAFLSADKDPFQGEYNIGPQSYLQPTRTVLRLYNDKTIITSIYTRIAIDVAAVDIRHVKLDEAGRYSEDMNSHLQDCLTIEPNLDQGPRAWRQDLVTTLFGHGAACVVPVDTTVNPETNEIFDVYSMRIGNIIGWYPHHVKVSLYNEKKGYREDIVVEKRFVSIIENPLYSVMNEPTGTLQRLLRKLTLLDTVDEASSSGKLDIMIQLPYTIKSEARRQQAEKRRTDIEFQLSGSKYGIAYVDGTEKITQLNRPAENNMLTQVEFLMNMLYGELGLTSTVMDGTADEATMINYYNRTVEPIIEAIVQGLRRSILGHSKLKAGEDILYFRNPFKLIPLKDLAEVVDKFTRNEILSANEIRQAIGFRPSKDPKADQLRNSNMPLPEDPASTEIAKGNADEV